MSGVAANSAAQVMEAHPPAQSGQALGGSSKDRREETREPPVSGVSFGLAYHEHTPSHQLSHAVKVLPRQLRSALYHLHAIRLGPLGVRYARSVRKNTICWPSVKVR